MRGGEARRTPSGQRAGRPAPALSTSQPRQHRQHTRRGKGYERRGSPAAAQYLFLLLVVMLLLRHYLAMNDPKLMGPREEWEEEEVK